MNQSHKMQVAVGSGVLLLGLALAAGAVSIPSAAGYGGVGPNFLPWVVAVSLTGCGVMIVREALTGGFRAMDTPTGAERAFWPSFAWVSAGLLVNAALLTTIGFILSCNLCYMLAVQGLKRAAGVHATRPRDLLMDLATGAAISAPVYWAFTKFLSISLPGLTKTGWL